MYTVVTIWRSGPHMHSNYYLLYGGGHRWHVVHVHGNYYMVKGTPHVQQLINAAGEPSPAAVDGFRCPKKHQLVGTLFLWATVVSNQLLAWSRHFLCILCHCNPTLHNLTCTIHMQTQRTASNVAFHMKQIVGEITVKRVFEWIWTFYADADHWQW